MDADRVIVELIAKVEGFDGKVKQSATAFEGSMKRIETAGARAEGAIRRTSIGTAQASTAMHRGFEDVGKFLNTSPNSPFVAPVKHAPQVASAMRLVATTSSILGGVLGGVVATGVLALVAALAELIVKGRGVNAEIADMVEKLKEAAEKAQLARRAKEIFGKSIEGVTKAIEDQAEAHRQLHKEQRTAGELDNLLARKNLESIDALNAETQALINNAKAHLQRSIALAPIAGAAGSEGVADREIRNAQKQLATLEALLAKSQASRDLAFRNYQESRATLAEEAGKRAADPIAQLNKQYDAEVKAAKKAAVATGEVTAALTKQIEAIEKRREAAIKAARAESRTDSSNRQSGRQITEADARAIVKSIGGTVTSGFRTPEHNKRVGGQDTSFHLKGQAVDIAKTAGLTLGKIVKAFEDKGVRLIEKLDEGDHFHIAFGKRGGGGPSQETLAKRAEAAADAEERRLQSYQNELAGLQQDEIDARQALITSAEEIARLELEAIEISRKKYNDNLASLVTTEKLQANEAAELQKINDERAKLRTELVGRREDERKFRMQEADARRATELQVGSKDAQADLLQSQAQLATTAKERHAIEKRLLELQYETERIQLEAIIADYERLKIKQDLTEAERQELANKQIQADLAQQRLGTIDQRQANSQSGNDQANAGPLQDYLSTIPDTAMEINEAFEAIAAGGLATFTDALTNAIVNFTSLKDVARATLQSIVAGLIKMGIQQLILATVGQAIGTGAAAATSAQMAAIGAAAAGPAALVSLATMGANAIPAQAALATTAALATAIGLTGRKEGGPIFGPGGPTGDKVPIMASDGEFMIKARSARNIGFAALQHMNQTGEIPGYAVSGGAVRAVRPSNAVAVAPRGSGGAELSSDAVSKLGGIVREAIGAMPPIQLFPTFDPSAALRAALNSSEGRQIMAEFMGDNSGMMNGTLAQ